MFHRIFPTTQLSLILFLTPLSSYISVDIFIGTLLTFVFPSAFCFKNINFTPSTSIFPCFYTISVFLILLYGPLVSHCILWFPSSSLWSLNYTFIYQEIHLKCMPSANQSTFGVHCYICTLRCTLLSLLGTQGRGRKPPPR